jgi:hypothetical protein
MKNKEVVGVIKENLMNSINELFTKIENSNIDENEYLQYANELKKIYDNTKKLIHIKEKEIDEYEEEDDYRIVIHEECELPISVIDVSIDTRNIEITYDMSIVHCVYESHNNNNNDNRIG